MPIRSSSRRQYGPEHRAERERWRPKVEAGAVWCAELVCLVERDGGDRWIEPGSEWDLAHDRTDVSGKTWLGPAHARCNRSEGQAHKTRLERGDIEAAGSLWWSP